MDRVQELAQRRANLLVELGQVTEDLRKELNGQVVDVQVVKPAKPRKTKAVKARKARKPRKAQVEKPAEDATPRITMKTIVQEILAANKDGLQLAQLVAEVEKVISKGGYKTKAKSTKSITQLVSQALDALKKSELVVAEKSDENKRSTYKLTA
jgi:hypothetical protein